MGRPLGRMLLATNTNRYGRDRYPEYWTLGLGVSTYFDVQPVGIPSYLIAIASGNLRYKPFPAIEGRSWKSGVWAEPELLEACYWEFCEDTGRSVSGLDLPQVRLDLRTRFLAKEEDIVGPYKFGVYDLLVLPPSFPYGGMVSPATSLPMSGNLR